MVIDCLTNNQQVFNTHYGQLDQSRINRILEEWRWGDTNQGF